MLHSIARLVSILLASLAPLAPVPALAQCNDSDGDGFFGQAGCGGAVDCNDAAATTYPGAPEACDGYDNDCDALLDEGCVPACSDPLLFARDRRITEDDHRSESPSLAWTGNGFGVAWADARSGESEIYFARLDAAGNRIGPDVRVTSAPGYSQSPSLVWTGSQFGVAWADDRNAANVEIYFARLDVTGNRIGGDVRVTDDPAYSDEPSLVWNGTQFGLAWTDTRTNLFEIYFAALGAAGDRIGGDVQVTHSESTATSPALVWRGGSYGVAWTDGRGDAGYDVYFARLDTAGGAVGNETQVTNAPGDSEYPSLVWNGSGYALAWKDLRNGDGDVYFARLDTTGGKLGNDVRVTTSSSDTWPGPSLVWTGIEYGVAWSDMRDASRELYFARLDTSGDKVGNDLRVSDDLDETLEASVAWTGKDFGIAWSWWGSDIYFDRASRGCGEPDADGDGYRAHVDCDEGDPAVHPGAAQVCDGKNDDCDDPAWPAVPPNETDLDLDGFPLCAGDCNPSLAPVHPGAPELCDGWDNDCDGTIDGCACDLDGDGFGVCSGDCNAADASAHPGATEICDGQDNDCDGVLDAAGCAPACTTLTKLADDEVVTTPTARAFGTALVWNGSGYGLAYLSDRFATRDIYFQGLDAAGQPLGPERRVTDGAAYFPAPPVLVWTGRGYGVAWEDFRDGNGEIYFASLDGSGAKIGLDVRVTFDLSESLYPSLAWSGEVFGLAWPDSSAGNLEIHFARLDAGGARVAPITKVTNALGDSVGPSIAWNGAGWTIVWTDNRDGKGEVYFARLGTTGSKIGSDRRITYSSADREVDLVALAWGAGAYGLVWSELYFGSTDNLRWARLDETGATTASDVVTLDSTYGFDLAWTGGEFGVVWSTGWTGNIGLARFDAGGASIGPDLSISDSSSFQGDPALAWNGAQYGVAWYRGPIRFARAGCCGASAEDLDADGIPFCAGDCADEDPARHPGATETCNAIDDDCDLLVDENALGVDTDGDDVRNACDNCVAAFNPLQEDFDGDSIGEYCDNCPGLANAGQTDLDLDRAGDACDNCIGRSNPGQRDRDDDLLGDACDNCTGLVNPDQADADLDGAGDACDNCTGLSNPGQRDRDQDARGDACDNCLVAANPDQADLDLDGAGDDCDNCGALFNADQADGDRDHSGDDCDNCTAAFNPAQTDEDDDGEGDACDLDDGTIYLWPVESDAVAWHEETGHDVWNLYRGDLAALRAAGVYTQIAGPLALKACSLAAPEFGDAVTPPAGGLAFYLVTGVASGIEGSLGQDSAGAERPNTNPCP